MQGLWLINFKEFFLMAYLLVIPNALLNIYNLYLKDFVN